MVLRLLKLWRLQTVSSSNPDRFSNLLSAPRLAQIIHFFHLKICTNKVVGHHIYHSDVPHAVALPLRTISVIALTTFSQYK